MAVDLALDAVTHDIVVVDGDMLVINNAERVAQQIKIQLLTFYGEWFLDTGHGVPYLEYIMVKNPNVNLVKQILREQILEVDDVDSVDEIEVYYNAQERVMTVRYDATTPYGLVTKKEVLGYGYR